MELARWTYTRNEARKKDAALVFVFVTLIPSKFRLCSRIIATMFIKCGNYFRSHLSLHDCLYLCVYFVSVFTVSNEAARFYRAYSLAQRVNCSPKYRPIRIALCRSWSRVKCGLRICRSSDRAIGWHAGLYMARGQGFDPLNCLTPYWYS